MSYYYIKAADKYVTVDQKDYKVKTVKGNHGDDYKWLVSPVDADTFTVRHDVTNCYLEIPATGTVNAITSENNNTTLSLSISDDATISNHVLKEPAYFMISGDNGVTTTDATKASKFSIKTSQ